MHEMETVEQVEKLIQEVQEEAKRHLEDLDRDYVQKRQDVYEDLQRKIVDLNVRLHDAKVRRRRRCGDAVSVR